ncbi:MAG: SusC/RagA family TonB-linked outer membrane protein [Saprospiraceae bacterium]|nr:SusC/RagA family TonB-linked outer membrane protein [Saprospiraceae bacterium]
MKRILTTLCLLLAVAGMAMAQRTVSGTVTGDDGETLIGATVSVKGTSGGARTDLNGRYSVQVPEGSNTLVFSYTGYQTQELSLGASNVADVVMVSGTVLQEAVVTALGITREEKSLGYAVQSLDGDQFTSARDASNVVNSLSGKIAGVNVISSSGNVGSSSRITIRGNNSITGDNQPLFVVNGIPVDNSSRNFAPNGGTQFGGVDFGNAIQDINPDDIETVTVLKGPNAASLYGSRGANGVILITTKTGKGAQKGLGVSYTGDIGFSNPLRLPSYQNKFGQGVDFQFNYVDGTGNGVYDGTDESWGPSFDSAINGADGIDNNGDGTVDEQGEGEMLNQFMNNGALAPWVAQPDNVNSIFETGVAFTNNIAITANGDKANARFSYTNFNQTGMVPNTDLKRNTFNLGFGMKMNEKITAEGNVTYTLLNSDNRPGIGYDGDNILQQTIWAGRQVDWEYLRANYNQLDNMGRVVNWNHNYQNNPFFSLYRNTKPQTRNRINGYYAMHFQLLEWLKLSGRIGTDYYNDYREVHFDKGTNTNPNGRYDRMEYNSTETNSDVMLTANKNINDNISIVATAGVARRDNRFLGNEQSATALVVPSLFNFSNADGNVLSNNFLERQRINSVLGSVSLGFYNFIYLDGSIRNDWSSTLPADNNSFMYPAVNLAVVLSEKITIPGVTYLKVRGGYAEAGKDTRPYRLNFTYGANAPWGGLPNFTVPGARPNNQLNPERSKSFETGLEARFWQDRVRLDLTYYNTNTIDQIIPLNVSSTTGFTSRITNAGTIQNDGVEIQFGLTPVRTKDFRWDIDLNWAKNNSLVKDLPEGVSEITINTNWGIRLVAREGEEYGVLVGRRVKRAPDGQIIVNEATGSPVLDVDENGSNTNFVLGSITPDWVGGIRNTFTWKGLSLSALIDARQGSDLFSMTYVFGRFAGVLEESLEGRNTLDEVMNGYNFGGVYETVDANGNITYSPNQVKRSAEAHNADFYNRRHDRGVFDASFVKLREVTLGYDLPRAWFQNSFVNGLRLSVYGRNLALLDSNVPHVDPETAFDNSNAMQGIEFGQLPSARTIGITLNANF